MWLPPRHLSTIKDNDDVHLSQLLQPRFCLAQPTLINSTQLFACSLFITLLMEAVRTYERLVCFNKITQCYIQEGCHLLSDLL
jgi:hypothetical protein